jgi:hypothetical protein
MTNHGGSDAPNEREGAEGQSAGDTNVEGVSKPQKRGFQKGYTPKNKGKEMPAEILRRDQIDAVLNSFAYTTNVGRRNRALVQLLYRAEAKIGQVVALLPGHYDTDTGVLTLPPQQKGKRREVRLDAPARQDLERWLEARDKLGMTRMDPLFCTVTSPTGKPISPNGIRQALSERGKRLRINRRVTPEGIRRSHMHHRESESGRFEASVAQYVNAEAFRKEYATAYEKWADAHDFLERAPDRNATVIGHLCREAINEFSDQLAWRRRLARFETNKTKDKIRKVFEAERTDSRTVKTAAIALAGYWDALIEHWEAVSDLANRQEHNTELAAEDSRRIVFQTMFVMREIDLALNGPRV